MAIKIDHVVINAKTNLTVLETVFGYLGFRLSPRGFHSLGSINHLAMFASTYLELIGVSPEQPDARPEVSRGSTGIDGLVLQTDDADVTHESLRKNGFHPTEVQEFSRPVDLGDTIVQARFRTVRFERSPFKAGRVYFCQHLTPELVWQEGMGGHPNRSRHIREIAVVSEFRDEQARLFAGLAQRDFEMDGEDLCVPFDGCLVRILSPESYHRLYGDSALVLYDTREFFGAVMIECENPPFFDRYSAPDDWRCVSTRQGGARITSQQHRILIDFTQSGDHNDEPKSRQDSQHQGFSGTAGDY